MGDGEKAPLRLQFNPKVRLEFHGSTITSDAGLLAFREFDDALGLTEIAEDYLQESRTGRNILHHLVPLLRQSIYSRLAGYDDTNDAVRLSQDPAMRVIVGWQGSERKGASTSEMGRFETEFLTQEDNLKGLARINTQWVERAMAHTLHRRVILDMDSSESPVHGQQEGAAYNGHFECVCYHPLFLFNQFGDCEAAKLRSGNVPSADDWQEVLDPVVERYLTAAVRLLFRADAAFAKPEIYDYLEARNIGYAIRLRSNQVLQREIAPRLIRPTEWLSPKPIVSYHDFVYQAQSWNVARRVVSKVEWHQGELFPRVGFIVTNLSYPNIGIVRFYNGRGTAEQWMKEGKYALNWTRLSCHKFVANQVRNVPANSRQSGPRSPLPVSYPAISLITATAGRQRRPQKRLQTARQPPVYPNSSPDHRACNSLTPPPLSSRPPSGSIGGFGLSLTLELQLGAGPRRSVAMATRFVLTLWTGLAGPWWLLLPGCSARWSGWPATGRTAIRRPLAAAGNNSPAPQDLSPAPSA